MKIKLHFIILIALTLLTRCTQLEKKQEKENSTKQGGPLNIILLIGDGTGLTQISSGILASTEPLNYERFKQVSLIKTSSAREKVTDSAAGATAFATGKKTYNGAISVDADTVAQETILETLEKQGYKSGVISTSSITHATPACFYAHQPFRKMEHEIAAELIQSNVDFFAGGGLGFFTSEGNSLEQLISTGFEIDTTQLESGSRLDPNSRYGWLLAADGMPRMLDGRGDFLPQATRKALDHLKHSEKGFFLMVEGSQIDWGGHANDAEYIKTELLDFDQAIGVALDFAEADGNTLVVVTADHETGGFSLPGKDGYSNLDYAFNTGGHTATMVPTFAYGPGSERFAGIYENTGIYDKIKESVGN